MKQLKKVLLLVLAAAMVLSLLACAKTEPAQDAQQDDQPTTVQEDLAVSDNEEVTQQEKTEDQYIEVNVGISVDPASFAPAAASNTGREAMMQLVYEKLFCQYETGGEYAPRVGKTKEYENDGKDIRVTIWDNVYDSTGNHITTADIVYSYEKMRELGFSEHYTYLESMEIVDDYTMIFHHTEANPSLESYTFEKGFVFSKAAFEASGDGFALTPVGTGRYVLSDYVAGSYYTFEENKDYWGLANGEDTIHPFSYGNADKITYKIISDNAQMANALKTGSIDMINNLGAEQVEEFYDPMTKTTVDGYTVNASLSTVSYCLQFNASAANSACADVNIRRAIAYCVDNQTVVDIVLEGRGMPNIAGTIVENVTDLVDWDELRAWQAEEDNVYHPGSNIELAKQCLADAGYPDGIHLVCMTNTDATMVKAAQVVQSLCGQAGIEIEIVSYDSALFDTYRCTPDSGWDMLSTCWGRGHDIYFHNGLLFNPDAYGELGNRNFITTADDPTLFELKDKMCAFGSTSADADAFIKYAFLDQVYDYALFNRSNYIVAQDGVASIYVKDNIVPQLCTYTAEYQCGEPSGK